MQIHPDKDTRSRMVASIQRFLQEETGEEVGALKAGRTLDFFLEELAPSVYNQAIADAQRYFQDRAADLENVCFATEFSYWNKHAGKGVARRPDTRR